MVAQIMVADKAKTIADNAKTIAGKSKIIAGTVQIVVANANAVVVAVAGLANENQDQDLVADPAAVIAEFQCVR